MARTQVLVQLDDDLVLRLDRLARDVSVSRSELLRRGARALLEAADLAGADEALVESYSMQPQSPSMVETASRLAAKMVPEW
ncbi:MAG: ribbon-helix-helix protein, CopG family [Actinomycetia bacterium]|nr:ribbon-helix-helix protein, CopG family [Actinomycetes bacterium]